MRKRKRQQDKSSGLKVLVRNNNVEKAISIFKQKVKNSGLMLELKQKSFYEKPSEKRRQRNNLAKLRAKHRKKQNS